MPILSRDKNVSFTSWGAMSSYRPPSSAASFLPAACPPNFDFPRIPKPAEKTSAILEVVSSELAFSQEQRVKSIPENNIENESEDIHSLLAWVSPFTQGSISTPQRRR
jgi:hypothetical protein